MINNYGDNMKKRNLVITLLLVLGIISITIGVSVAFFNYTRTGSENTIAVGRIYFTSSQNGTINLSNVFPISSEEVLTDTDNTGSVSITVRGDTDYYAGVEYLLSVTEVNNVTQSGKKVPINLNITVNGSGLGTEETDDYYENRESYTESKYKIEYNGNLRENAHLLVGFITPNTTLGTIEGIEETINIKAYLDKDRIAISDTYDETISDEFGTTSEWVDGRMVLTTDEWNSFQSDPISFKIRVEANEGIWVQGSTDCNCFDTVENGDGTLSIVKFNKEKYIYTVNNDMTNEEIMNCVQYIEDFQSGNSGGDSGGTSAAGFNMSSSKIKFLDSTDEIEAFCRGTGKLDFGEGSGEGGETESVNSFNTKNATVKFLSSEDGMTFQEAIDHNIFKSSQLEEMLINNYIIKKNILPNSCNTMDVIIPKRINNKTVVKIESGAFSYSELARIEIPDSIITIGNRAFANNQLANVTIPNSVITIGNDAFSSNQLTSVTIPNSVTTIGYDAFSSNQLTSVTIPNSVTTIGYDAFSWNQLTNVTIPNSVKSLGNNAFRTSSSLSLSIDMTTIPNYFSHNQNITNISSLTIGNNVTTIGNYAFINTKLTSLVIPNNIITIGDRAFYNDRLTAITIPNSVTTIGESAFSHNQLISVVIGNGIESIGEDAFETLSTGNNNLATITIDKSCPVIESMSYVDWLGMSYRVGTNIYGSNNELCGTW